MEDCAISFFFLLSFAHFLSMEQMNNKKGVVGIGNYRNHNRKLMQNPTHTKNHILIKNLFKNLNEKIQQF